MPETRAGRLLGAAVCTLEVGVNQWSHIEGLGSGVDHPGARVQERVQVPESRVQGPGSKI
eukprot:432256-Rhodomonas_salina.1